jgi:hypothetical protein
LKPWIPRVKEVAGKVDRVFGYFNNHYHGYAVENCLQVLEMLGVLTPEQAEAKANVERYLRRPPEMERTVIKTLVPLTELKLQDLLSMFMDKQRLKRALRIKDAEMSVQRVTDTKVEASVRDYHIVIDLANRVVLHDCADWSRCVSDKRFCKHVGKLMLTLNEKKALEIMSKIYSEKQAWEFKPYTE